MKKKNILLVSLIFIFAAVVGSAYIFKEIFLPLYNKIAIVNAIGMGKNILSVEAGSDAVENDAYIWDSKYQKKVDSRIQELIKHKNYTIKHPLIIYNPFGTNTCSVNAYFSTDKAAKIECTVAVKDDSIGDFKNVLYNGTKKAAKNHAYQIVGLVPEKKNEVTLRALDGNNSVIGIKTFTIAMGKLHSKTPPNIKIKEGTSGQKLTNGLFTVLGHDKASSPSIYMYDNEGVIRSEIPLQSYRTDRIEFVGEKMILSYSVNQFAIVNRLGKVERTYDLKNWILHHDFIYDKDNNNLLILASKKDGNTVEDMVVSLNLKTGKASELLDLKDYLMDVKEKAAKYIPASKINSDGSKGLDWIHLNTINVVHGKDVLLSSRELSTIIRINDVYSEPKLKYFIADKTVWNNSNYDKINLTKLGDFVSQAGQHSITYKEDSSLPNGQYYLYMFNNNFKGASSRPNFDWSAYPGTGLMEKGPKSMFYRYLIDENAGTYKLVEQFSLPYSSIVSSVEEYGENYVTSSGKSNCYNEYDSDGILIRQYNYSSSKFAYRVFKYSFGSFWFEV